MLTFLNILEFLAFWRFLSSVHRLHSTLLRHLLPNLPCLAHFDSSLKSVLFVFPLMFQPVMCITRGTAGAPNEDIVQNHLTLALLNVF